MFNKFFDEEKHVDLYHKHWITQNYEIVAKINKSNYELVKNAIFHHLKTEPHYKGQCYQYDPNPDTKKKPSPKDYDW